MALAQALLGSLAQQPLELPPPVQAPPPADPEVAPVPEVASVPQADDIPEVPFALQDDLPATEQKEQAAESPTPRYQLLKRLLRALPIASADQLSAMINVFDPTRVAAPPPPAQFSNPTVTFPQSHPGGLPYAGSRSNDPLHHLLAQPSLKRSEHSNIVQNYLTPPSTKIDTMQDHPTQIIHWPGRSHRPASLTRRQFQALLLMGSTRDRHLSLRLPRLTFGRLGSKLGRI